MAKKLLSSMIVLSLLIIITSCSSNNNTISNAFLQKRKHTKGYHVNLGLSRHNANKKTRSLESLADEESSQIFEEEHQPLALTKTEIQPKIEDVKRTKGKEIVQSTEKGFFAKSAETNSFKKRLKIKKVAKSISIEESALSSIEASKESASTEWSTAAFIAISFSLIGLFVLSIPLGIAAIIFGIIAVTSILKAEKKGKEKNGYTLGILGALIGAIEATVTILFLSGLI